MKEGKKEENTEVIQDWVLKTAENDARKRKGKLKKKPSEVLKKRKWMADKCQAVREKTEQSISQHHNWFGTTSRREPT